MQQQLQAHCFRIDMCVCRTVLQYLVCTVSEPRVSPAGTRAPFLYRVRMRGVCTWNHAPTRVARYTVYSIGHHKLSTRISGFHTQLSHQLNTLTHNSSPASWMRSRTLLCAQPSLRGSAGDLDFYTALLVLTLARVEIGWDIHLAWATPLALTADTGRL